MRTIRFKKSLPFIVCFVLIAAMALLTTGCDGNRESSVGDEISVPQTEVTALGEGETSFDLTVTDAEGKTAAFLINTDKETVGDALIELGLLAGEEGPFGLYVKTVNGITADYDTDKKYWAFYVGDKYAPKGVDLTVAENGASYAFRVE